MKATKCKIETYFHCAMCAKELPPGTAPVEYARLSVGYTPHGIQVWCDRHEANVIHFDFEGRNPPTFSEDTAVDNQT